MIEAIQSTSLSRVTCCVHHHVSPLVSRGLQAMGVPAVVVESGRTVRQRTVRNRRLWKRQTARLEDSPADLFRFDVPRGHARRYLLGVSDAVDMTIPGRGTIYVQDVEEFRNPVEMVVPDEAVQHDEKIPLLRNLALLTFVLSSIGSGERLAGIALELGTGVPLVTLGTGTGMRDRLGLLRITIPPEKELVHLVVPSFDAEGLIRLFIEEGRLNGPGKGFVYSSPVGEGLLDTRLRIGSQKHAASMEQVVAAIDKLHRGTEWRRRFDPASEMGARDLSRDLAEITVICAEERSGALVSAAQRAGAAGATLSRVRKIYLEDTAHRDSARERCIITLPRHRSDAVIREVMAVSAEHPDWVESVQVLSVPAGYSYRNYARP